MTLLTVAIEYLLLSAIFETMRQSGEEEKESSIDNHEDYNLLPVYNSHRTWKPLSVERLYIIDEMIENNNVAKNRLYNLLRY